MARASMSMPNRLCSRIADGMSPGSRTDGSVGHPDFPAFSISSRIHAVEQAKRVLTEMHRAARWIDQGDIDGALEGRYLPVAGDSLVADTLASARHKIIQRPEYR